MPTKSHQPKLHTFSSRFAACLVALTVMGTAAQAQTAAITLLYDNTESNAPYDEIYLAGNWNKTTGAYDAGWEGFARVPMYDDGAHGDGAAGDGVWGYIANIQPDVATFQWAADVDPCGGNGWLGNGEDFTVPDTTSQTIQFFGVNPPGPYPYSPPCAGVGHPSGVTIDHIYLWQVKSSTAETGTISVRLGNFGSLQAGDELRARLIDLDGTVLDEQTVTPVGEYTNFNYSAGYEEGGYRLVVDLINGEDRYDRAERVYSVVDDVANDVRYGFYSLFGGYGGDYTKKADMLVDCYLNAIEYYDWFPGHGDYTPPNTTTYTQQPFGGTVYLQDLQEKMSEARNKRIQNIAYIAAYAGLPSIVSGVTNGQLLNSSGDPVVFFNGMVGTEADLGGAWFYLTAFADGTDWRTFLWGELTDMLDADDTVAFDGVELDTYGWTDPYYDAYTTNDGTPIMTMLSSLTSDVQGLVKSINPEGLTTLNNVAEDGVDQFYDSEDFLFVENWAFHKPQYAEVVDMVFGRIAASGKRFVSKCYPADMTGSFTAWPAENLRLLMGAHLTGGGSFMVAGDPRESTDEIGGFNSLYYPDNEAQTATNFDIIKKYNAVDAALYTRNHGPGVQPRATDLTVGTATTRLFRGADNAATWSLLNLDTNTHWNVANTSPTTLTDQAVTVTLPNGLVPARVLYTTPDDTDLVYPKALEYTVSNNQVSTTLPNLQTFGALIVEPIALTMDLTDSADDAAYDTGWDAATSGGTGWTDNWTFTGRSGTANIFIGDSTSNGAGSNNDADINTGRKAWALYSGTTELIDATRNFPSLTPGDSLRLHMDNGWVSSGGSVGFNLRNSSGESLLEFYFAGGDSFYSLVDGSGVNSTSIGFTDQGLDIEFTLTGTEDYSIRIVPIGAESTAQTITGTLPSPSGGQDIARLRLYSFAAGTGANYDVFFNDISVYARPDTILTGSGVEEWLTLDY